MADHNPGQDRAKTADSTSESRLTRQNVSFTQVAAGVDAGPKDAGEYIVKPALGSKWAYLENEFSFMPKSITTIREALPVLKEKLEMDTAEVDAVPGTGMVVAPIGWYFYLGNKTPIHKSVLQFARLLMYRRIAGVKPDAPFLKKSVIAHAGTTPMAQQTYSPKVDEAYFLIVSEGKSIAEAATLLNIRPSIIERWCNKGNWMSRRIEAEHITVKAAGAETVQDRAIALKTTLLQSVQKAQRRLEQMEMALQKKWEVALADTEEIIFRDGENKEHKRRVVKASEARLSSLLGLNGLLIKQMQELTIVGSARLLDDNGRIKKLREAKKHRFGRKNVEMLGRATAFKDGE
jgi:hypothetical protein